MDCLFVNVKHTASFHVARSFCQVVPNSLLTPVIKHRVETQGAGDTAAEVRLIPTMISVVPALKARVLAIEFIKKNPKLTALLDHPAGPFTSK